MSTLMLKSNRGRVRRIAIVLVASALVLRCETAQDVVPPELEELAPGFPYASWFAEHTGFDPVPADFGVYTMLPLAGTLYLGFGAGLPAAANGALLAAFDDEGIRPVAPLHEQGMLDMATGQGMLLIPGVDPCCPDGWEAGNFYTYAASAGLTKWRNLPNVLHAWGVWHDAADNAVYVAASSHRGDFTGSVGEIWRTVDLGAHWARLANDDDGVGDYRTYDVLGHRGRLYATSAESRNSCTLVAQPEVGTVWMPVLPDERVACHHRLVSFGDALIAVDSTRRRLHVVTGQGDALQRELPFTTGETSPNWATVAGAYLYALSSDGRILLTRDLAVWETVAEMDQEFLTIQYWPQRSWLVLASRGANGALWKLELCGAAPC
jgi:hypothetical protein